MTLDEIIPKLQAALPEIKLRKAAESILVESPEHLVKLARHLKESPDLRFDYLSSVTGADYLAFLEVVYHLFSVEKKTGPLVVRVRAGRENPKIPSVFSVYRGAEFQEREVYDMYGVVFEGHPDLRRIFMWDTFEGFPLRKDYQQEDSETLDETDVRWLAGRNIRVPENLIQKPAEPKPGNDSPAERDSAS